MVLPDGPIDLEWLIRVALLAIIAIVGYVARRRDKEVDDARKEVSGLIGTVTEQTGAMRELKDAASKGFEMVRENREVARQTAAAVDRVERRLDQVYYERARER